MSNLKIKKVPLGVQGDQQPIITDMDKNKNRSHFGSDKKQFLTKVSKRI